MQHTAAIVLFPAADSTTLIIVALCFVALFGGAIVADRVRRWREEKERIQAELQSVDAIAREKGLSDSEDALLKELVERWGDGHPVKVVTTRPAFASAAEKELAAVRARGDHKRYRELGVELRDIRERLGLDYIPYGKPITSTRDLYEGQMVDLGPVGGGKGLTMRVASVDEAFYYLAPRTPGKDEPPADWQPGTDFSFNTWRDDDAAYRWKARMDRIEDKPARWVFDHSHKLQREQKREHFRVRFDQTIDIELVPAPADDNFESIEEAATVARIRGRVTSLSAGGVAIEVNQALPRNVCLRMSLPLKRAGTARGTVRVLSSTLLSGGRMAVRGEFVHLDEGAEDRIAKYVLEWQQFQIARPMTKPAS